MGTHHFQSGHELNIVHGREGNKGTNRTRYCRVHQHVSTTSHKRDLCNSALISTVSSVRIVR